MVDVGPARSSQRGWQLERESLSLGSVAGSICVGSALPTLQRRQPVTICPIRPDSAPSPLAAVRRPH
jgi:hypothetical protein